MRDEGAGTHKDTQPETGGPAGWPGVAGVSSLSPQVGEPRWSCRLGVEQAESSAWGPCMLKSWHGVGWPWRQSWAGRTGLRGAGPRRAAEPGPDLPCDASSSLVRQEG